MLFLYKNFKSHKSQKWSHKSQKYSFPSSSSLICSYFYRDVLKISKVSQLKFVVTEDLEQIGLSRPEQRRYKKIFSKYFPNPYIYKLRKLLSSHKKNEPVSTYKNLCYPSSSGPTYCRYAPGSDEIPLGGNQSEHYPHPRGYLKSNIFLNYWAISHFCQLCYILCGLN